MEVLRPREQTEEGQKFGQEQSDKEISSAG